MEEEILYLSLSLSLLLLLLPPREISERRENDRFSSHGEASLSLSRRARALGGFKKKYAIDQKLSSPSPFLPQERERESNSFLLVSGEREHLERETQKKKNKISTLYSFTLTQTDCLLADVVLTAALLSGIKPEADKVQAIFYICVFYVRVFMKSKFFRSSSLSLVFSPKREKEGQKNEIFGDLDFPALIVDRCFSPANLNLGGQKIRKREPLLSLFVCLFVPSLILLKRAAIINRARNDDNNNNNNNNSAQKRARVLV